MKQIKQSIIIMLFSLIYFNVIEEINSTNLQSLYYTNSELSNLNVKTKKPLTKSKSSKKNANKNKNVITIKSLPIGFSYLPVKDDNVYVRTMNFYIRLLKMIGDARDFGSVSKAVVKHCNNVNIFEDIRESLLNCRVISSSIKDRVTTKTLYMGCMANLFSLVKSKCPKVFEKSSSLININAAIIKLTNVDKRLKGRLQIDANIFIKKLSFFMRVFSGVIQKRILLMNAIRAEQVRQEAKKRAELLKLAKLNKAKRVASNAKPKNAKKEQKVAKKAQKIAKKNLSGKKAARKNVKGKPKANKMQCNRKCKKGTECKINCKKTLIEVQVKKTASNLKVKGPLKILLRKFTVKKKDTIRKNSKEDNEFVKEMELTGFKASTISSLFGHWIINIAHI